MQTPYPIREDIIKDITDFIFLSDEPEPCDMIFVPGSSKSVYVERAARLYHAGYAPYILPSGRFSSKFGRFAAENIDNPRYAGEYPTEFAYCRQILLENGVPDSAILREDRATNSMENAQFSAEVLKLHGLHVRRAILSCQSFHARRAYMSYAVCMPETSFCIVPTDTLGITRDNWYQSERGFRRVMGELAKCGMYFKDLGALLPQEDTLSAKDRLEAAP